MSLELHAFLNSTDAPDRSHWQASIAALGFPVELDPQLDVSKNTGFVPCTKTGEASGFEFYTDTAQDLLSTYSHLFDKLPEYDCVFSFRWGGDMNECACVMAAASALVKDFGAAIYYPDDDLLYSEDDLIAEARQCF